MKGPWESPSGSAAITPRRHALGRAVWPAATLGLMLVSFEVGHHVSGGFNSLPAIARTLPGEESEFSRELNDRIRERFPIGANEDNLIGYLDSEKFTPEWRRRDGPNASFYVRQGLLCKQIVRILWRSDAAGVLTDVNGSYQSQCT
jgi:hypothetical protein